MIKWIPIKMANAYVIKHHSHHGKVQGAILALGLFEGEELVGVAIMGRPSSRHLDSGMTSEVTRLCIKRDEDGKGYKNGCSQLYAACARVAKDLGLNKIITFILQSETGISLKASGWFLEEEKCGRGEWNSSKDIKRSSTVVNLFGEKRKYPNESKQRWAKLLN